MLRESNESEIETLKNSLKNVPEINGDPEELIAEINERNTRVNNVMVYKLNESNSQSLNERILHDKAEVVKILDIIDIKEDVIENVIRVEINGDPEELIAEINERNSRVNNVMVYKLNESNSRSLNERILHDKAEVVKILDIIDIKEDVIENVIRVGEKGTKPRPMKIVL
ncbi:hypothetical protein HHI36_018096 [Cryptolaemus montrouzieri]|uniref:Uncharacterized protein n=1 Tax=Cryptolaemus montrouzieri TaxID=559131 RepID=A0ABD2NZD5_9CUCU